jgi:hypothetical protein
MNNCLLCLSLFCGSAFAVEHAAFNEKIVPIHEEPNHRHVLHSKSIRVFDAYFPPQKASLYHSHEKDSVLICLDGGEVTNELPGQEVIPRPPIPSGLIYYKPYSTTPLVHRIKNLSTTPFRILDIEVLKPIHSSSILATPPDAFNVVIENERVRVSKIHLAKGQSTGKVNFLSTRLLAITEAGKILIASEQQSQSIEVARGSLDVQELPHTETITNIGESDVEIVAVEIK